MKVWSDLSSIIKVAVVCMVVGFFLGLCTLGTIREHPASGQIVAAGHRAG